MDRHHGFGLGSWGPGDIDRSRGKRGRCPFGKLSRAGARDHYHGIGCHRQSAACRSRITWVRGFNKGLLSMPPPLCSASWQIVDISSADSWQLRPPFEPYR